MILYGHRGAAGQAPENTLAGFAYARAIGVRAFELDVRLSADDQLVVVHDETLERTTNGVGRVSDFTAAQLQELDVRGAAAKRQNPVGVPTLRQVLQAHHDLDAFQLEIKSNLPDALEQVCSQLVTQIEYFQINGRTIVTSFDPIALEIMRRHAPRLQRGLIAAYERPEDLYAAEQLECWTVCIPLATSSREMVAGAQRKGFHVTGWLGNTVADLETLLDWGVDSITSDYPSVAIPFLRERRLWD